MHKAMLAVALGLTAGGAMLPQDPVLARDCTVGVPGNPSYSSARAGMRGWVGLHRPDGEVIRIKIDQIVFVMSALNTGADKRALSRIQLLNGFADVRENTEDVMLAIRNDDVVM
jgi:hypothetical protein